MSEVAPDRKSSWWKDGVIYQIYPRSFNDTNADGIGDLPGITEKLDYLAKLGVRGIWLSPVNRSPMFDFGYDVSDYRDIDPIFGTLGDFLAFVEQAHRRDIRVIMDIVLNHTSHLHPWFIESSSSRDNPKRDWYIWHDGLDPRAGGRPKPPNNWLSIFGGGAWQWEKTTESYYLHSFVAQQPDLNWFNPQVREAAYGEVKFWLDHGVDGFRFDVINWFGHDREFRSNPLRLNWPPRPYEFQRHIHDRNHPVSHEISAELRKLVDSYDDRMMVSEVYSEPPGDPALSGSYAGSAEFHMSFDFRLLYQKWNARAWFAAIASWDEVMTGRDAWPCYVLSNHDQPRSRSRFGTDSLEKARVAAVLHMTLRGTPFLYYGEELGMVNRRIPRAQLSDPVGIRYWPLKEGRDPERTPMQWDASTNAGFTTGTPWLPVHDNYRSVNAESELADEGSLLNLYRHLIALRNSSPVLQRGDWTPFDRGENGVISYFRSLGSERRLVALNFRTASVTISPPPAGPADEGTGSGERPGPMSVELSTHRRPGDRVDTGAITLGPLEATIFNCGD